MWDYPCAIWGHDCGLFHQLNRPFRAFWVFGLYSQGVALGWGWVAHSGLGRGSIQWSVISFQFNPHPAVGGSST